jgi:signal transduction histidine kinase
MKQPLPAAKILIIDDEPSNVRLLERVLEHAGGVVWRATTDPREAVPLFAEFQPDLVLTDLHMPHLDGYHVISQIRQLLDGDSFLPIVMLTADISPETRRKALRSGASDFITKPLDTTEVQLRIRNLLENRFLNLRLEETVRQRTRELESALEKLQNAQEQVVKQERLRALGMMAGGIAHDFNNALTMILGYGELLLPWFQNHAPVSKERGYATHIVAAAQDATHVVSRLREFYRPAGTDEVRVVLDPRSLCEQAVAFTTPKWKGRARASGVAIDVTTDLRSEGRIMGCGPELREVLTNLIFNACDAMPTGGSIVVRTRDDGGFVRMEVADCGTGMTQEEVAKCLEPFYTTKGERGTGLGLSVAYGIIQRHGGTIEIQSEKGFGTVFALVLPVTNSESEIAQEEEAAEKVDALKVLVVDDQEIICELLSELLRADGHEAAVAFDGASALSLFKEREVDILITDQSMPGMSGEQLAREVKAIRPSARVILLTGFGEEMKAAGSMPEGIDMILGKPVTGSDLRKAIHEVVAQPV